MTEMPKPRFDPTVNLGHILSIISFIGMAVAAYYAMKADIRAIDQRVATLEKTIEKMTTSLDQLASVVVSSARQDERINALNLRVERVERDMRRTVP